ncbi:GH25 family lysozyme [Clostridium intestinale]|uniref:Glycosyl hydrolase family protein n=1 Tax=Clostridium intestinale URNW TaxID=1294142 RepID=U2N7H0_9CLOT|nr:GH25 family lysozyme [Clostridium intestinale]ERK31452.1 glycosyl hydrolase family protein [Clostridium intestinale URNW]
MIKGIDISNHQPSVDFNALKNSVQVVIMKATEGVTYKDPLLESHYQKAKEIGFPVGFYHFMSESTSPLEQAEAFYKAIKDKQYEILPCLDIETNNQNRSSSQITDRCLEFLNKFKELSAIDCMIYTGGYFGRDNLDSRIKRYKAWIAHYGVSSPMSTGFNEVVGHQYTSSGNVHGINGNVDLNNFTEGIFINVQQPIVEQPRQQVNTGDSSIRALQQEIKTQFDAGLVVDGIPGPKTLAAAPLVKEGAQGNITRWIQSKVGTTADGVFGPNTKQAVKNYQASRGLSADGIVGQNTWRKLLGL